MKISEIVAMLENRIESRMAEFSELTQIVKKMVDTNHNQKEIDTIYMKMAEIVDDLRPVESMIRLELPHINNLFDSLIILHAEIKMHDTLPE